MKKNKSFLPKLNKRFLTFFEFQGLSKVHPEI